MQITYTYSKVMNFLNLMKTNNLLRITRRYKYTNYEEVRIPTPWGHVAGKWWNKHLNQPPIICIHGWQHNCGSFDLLIPSLSNKYSYLAIDYPGHGFSSWLPEGMLYHLSDSLLVIQILKRYFGWPTVSFLGHSLGAQACFLFATVFPEEVDFVIQIDTIKPFSAEPGSYIHKIAKAIDKHFTYEILNGTPLSYTYEELQNKIYLGNTKLIDYDKCKYLLDRSIKESDQESGKYIFATDLRIRNRNMFPMQQEDLKVISKRITCPVITIRTIKSKYPEKEKYMKEIADILKITNKSFQYVEVEGNHNVHLNDPECISGVINNFLEKFKESRE